MCFDDFWAIYPRRVAKLDAMKAFDKALKIAPAADIIAGARRYAAMGLDPRFTKHPASWLNKGCWMDEETAPALSGVAAQREKLRQEIERSQQIESAGPAGRLSLLDWEGLRRSH